MQPRCRQLDNTHLVSMPLNLEKAFVEYPEPPGDVPAYIHDWMFQYWHLREKWKLLEVYRSEFCNNWG